MHTQFQNLPVSLLHLLRNTLILSHISPYLGLGNLVRLAATNKQYQDLIYGTPGVFRHAVLTTLAPGIFESDHEPSGVSELETTDQIYARPIRRVLQGLGQRNVLHDVRTLVLDGLSVPLTLLTSILCDDAYNVRILSLRGVKELGDEKLIQILRYIIRPSRPEGTPKLKGLYYFTPIEARADYSAKVLIQGRPLHEGITSSLGAQLSAGTSTSSGTLHKHFIRSSWYPDDPWYNPTGEVRTLQSPLADDWAQLIQACEGLIAFDAVLCRHEPKEDDPISLDTKPRMATISLGGCQKCGGCPEGPAKPGVSPESHLPLLAPPPTHSSSVKAAQRLEVKGLAHPTFIARARDCLKDRWCQRCNVWWCEACYTVSSRRVMSTPIGINGPEPSIKLGAEKHCYECGQLCSMCLYLTQKRCSTCREEYCIEHDSGCNSRNCAWCATGGRRTAILDY